jgi:hypothetical protein
MKKHAILQYCTLFLMGGLSSGAHATLAVVDAAKSLQAPPHFDLEMSSQEYQNVLSRKTFLQATAPLQNIIDIGKRNMQWLNYINSFRDDAHKIHLTKIGDETGIPIAAAKKYSDQTVLSDFAKWQREAPVEMADVLIRAQNLTQDPPVDTDVYIQWARKMDRIYQTGARWLLMQPYLGYLQARKADDVRGIYFLSQIPQLQTELSNWTSLPDDKKAQYREWLISLCYNGQSLFRDCAPELAKAEKNNTIYPYFQNYQKSGQDRWTAFFSIPQDRTDVQWTAQDSAEMKVPFLTPDSRTILNFLRDNIEDEWKTSNWNLRLDFQKVADISHIPHMEFAPGVTPHVNGIAGNVITMDQNAPLDEWDVRWTIRHEFGHVLGFVDCYVEYYEPTEKMIVSYQLDVTNLMCSRQGKLQTQHFDALKKVYFR